MSCVFVGLDCGGSSTRLLAVSSEGELLASAQSGSANLVSTPERRLLKNLATAAEGCPQPSYVCAGFAGLVSEPDRERALGYLRSIFPAATLRAEPDYYAAFAASEPGTDVCVIAGTGSLVCSAVNGRIVKSGGRGYLLGDEGSAYHYGRDALVQFLDDPNSVGAVVKESIERGFRTLIPNEVISGLYRAGSPQAVVGKIGKGLILDAKDGLPYALASIERHTRNLAAVVAKHLTLYPPRNPQEAHICLAGGVWQGAPVVRESFTRALSEIAPDRDYQITRIQRAPVQGAVDLARSMAGMGALN